MAKDAKDTKATKSTGDEKKPTPPKFEKPEFGIAELAKEMGITDPAALRVKLRGADGLKSTYKKGRSWDFGSKKNVETVAKQLAKPAKEKADAKPAKDAKGDKAKK